MNWKNWAFIHCSDAEIAAFFGIARETFWRRKNGAVLERWSGRAKGRAWVRRLQWAAAQKGNTGMLIWLGKQLLRQREETKIEHPGQMAVNDSSGAKQLLLKKSWLLWLRREGRRRAVRALTDGEVTRSLMTR